MNNIGYALAIAIAAASPVAAATPDAKGEVERLVERFNAARAAYDPVALAATLAPGFVEISPVGDVDDRAEVLGFYAPVVRGPVPTMTRTERDIAIHGPVGIETERVSFEIARPGATAITRSIRVRYVAAKTGGRWLLLSAQYTPIPPAK